MITWNPFGSRFVRCFSLVDQKVAEISLKAAAFFRLMFILVGFFLIPVIVFTGIAALVYGIIGGVLVLQTRVVRKTSRRA